MYRLHCHTFRQNSDELSCNGEIGLHPTAFRTNTVSLVADIKTFLKLIQEMTVCTLHKVKKRNFLVKCSRSPSLYAYIMTENMNL